MRRQQHRRRSVTDFFSLVELEELAQANRVLGHFSVHDRLDGMVVLVSKDIADAYVLNLGHAACGRGGARRSASRMIKGLEGFIVRG